MKSGIEPEAWTPASSGAERRIAGFLNTLDLDAGRVDLHGDTFDRLRRGYLQAVVLTSCPSCSPSADPTAAARWKCSTCVVIRTTHVCSMTMV